MKKVFTKILSFLLVATSMASLAGCEEALSQIFSSTDSSLESSVDSSVTESSIMDSSSIKESSSTEEEEKDGFDFAATDVEVVPYDGSEVTVDFYHCMNNVLQSVLNDSIERFNELYPNITIEHESKGGYPNLREAIKEEIAEGTAPSIAYCYADHVALYNEAQATVTLDGYIANTATVLRADGTGETMGLTNAQKQDFVSAYYKEGSAFGDGLMYTLPFQRSTEVMYYNKTYFNEHGLIVPATWTQMEEVCAQILAIESGKEGGLQANPCVPLGYDSDATFFITLTEQAGSGYTTNEKGNHFVFNNGTNRSFMKELRSWYEAGYIHTGMTYGRYTSNLFTQTDASKLKCYMTIGSSAGAGYHCPAPDGNGEYPFEVGVAMLPQIDPSNSKVVSQGPSLCLFKQEDPQEVAAAWLFMKFLTTDLTTQAKVSMAGAFTPVIQSVVEHPVYQDFLEKADGNRYLGATAIIQAIEQSSAYYISPPFPGSSETRDLIAELVAVCLLGQPENGATVDYYISYWFNEAERILKEEYDS